MSASRRGRRSGFLLYVVAGVLTVLAILGFALFNQMQDENLRVHRVYYGTAAVKIAEAAEAEAFAWYALQLSLPAAARHEYAQRLFTLPTAQLAVDSGAEPPSPDGRYLDLLQAGLLSVTAGVADAMTGRATLRRATLVYKDFKPLFALSPAAGQDLGTQGVVVPDPLERVGSLELRVEVSYGRVKRGLLSSQELTKSYVARRELKAVNLLPPVLGRFTLFARGFTGAPALADPMSPDEPYNVGHARLDLSGSAGLGVTNFAVNQPLVLVHHPDDVKERSGFCSNYRELCAYAPWEAPFDATSPPPGVLAASAPYRPDLQRRGWVFLGGSRPWRLNLQAGQGNPPVGGQLPAGYDQSWIQQSTVEGFCFHESYRTARATEVQGLPGVQGWQPIRAFPPGGTIPDYRFALFHFGCIADTTEQPAVRWLLLGNYYADPAHAREALRPSLLRLSGDVQATGADPAGVALGYLDRRSPTLVLGPVLRRLWQLGLAMQDLPGEAFPYPPAPVGVRQALLPYFSITPAGAYPGSDFRFPWNAPQWYDAAAGTTLGDLNVVDDTAGQAGVHVAWRVREHAFNGTPGPPLGVYQLIQSKVMNQPYNDSYDWIVENSNPSQGLDPKRHLAQDAVRTIGPASGTVPDRAFFYDAQDPNAGLCYFARNLCLRQYDDGPQRPAPLAADLFPDGYFRGALDALALYDPSQLPGNFAGDTTPALATYDLRQKTVFRYATEVEFKRALLPGSGDRLAGPIGISLVAQGGLDLSSATQVTFDEGGLIIVDGPVVLPSIRKSPNAEAARETLTFVSLTGDVTVAGPLVEASLVALGAGRTLKRRGDFLHVRGSVAVDRLDFSWTAPDDLFGPGAAWATPQPTGGRGLEGFARNLIEWDPALDPAAAGNYRAHHRAFMAAGLSYWKAGEL